MAALACVVALALPSAAADKPLALADAISMALEHNGEIKALKSERDIARAAITRAGLWANPTLELEGESGGLTGSSDENRFSVGLAQEFTLGGKRAKRLAVAQREVEEFDLRIADRQRLLTLEVKRAFLEHVLANRRLELARSSANLNRQLLEIAQQRYAAGEVPELEVNLARVEVARGAGRVLDVRRELPTSRSRLFSLMGLDPLAVAEPGEPPAHRPVTGSSDDLTRLALAHRPDLKALATSRAAAAAAVEAAEAERLPNLTAGLFFTHERSDDDTDTETRTRDNILGVRLSIPLPVFDRNQAGIQEARGRAGSADARLGAVRRAVEREVTAELARFGAAEEAVNLYEQEIIPRLDENLKIVQEAYRLGEIGILSVIEEQKKYHEVREGFLLELHNRDLARATLEATLGVEPANKQGGVQ